jgi:hypothetical protein
LVLGPSQSVAAQTLLEFGNSVLARIPFLDQAYRLILDSVKWGWRPMQILLDPDARFRGRQVWMPSKLVDQKPWFFRFTTDGKFVHRGTAGTREFTEEEFKLGWLIAKSGSIGDVYGTPLYRDIWFLWRAKTQSTEKMFLAIDRALGLFKVKSTGPPSVSVKDVVTEVEEILSTLTTRNVLVERPGISMEMLDTKDFSKEFLDVLRYLDGRIRTAITGETLTAEAPPIGSFALAKVHQVVRTDYAIEDAKVLMQTMNELIWRFIGFNFPEPDMDDLPRFENRIIDRVNMEHAKLLWDMQGPVDLLALGAKAGVPLVPGFQPEDFLPGA